MRAHRLACAFALAVLPLIACNQATGDPTEDAQFALSAQSASQAATNQLKKAASDHGVTVLSDLMTYVTAPDLVMVHAPIEGYLKYTDADFAAGARLMMVMVHSGNKLNVPDGTYLVSVEFPLPDSTNKLAKEGKARFFGPDGTVVAERPAYVRTVDEQKDFFPGTDPGPSNIPNITSTHLLRNGHYYVDCSGWKPFRTIYYPM